MRPSFNIVEITSNYIQKRNHIGGVMVSVLECGRSWVRDPVGSN
jgi:hypothetical protein